MHPKPASWAIAVTIDGEPILTIGSDEQSGVPDLDPYRATIRQAAEHLLAFIGPTAVDDDEEDWAF